MRKRFFDFIMAFLAAALVVFVVVGFASAVIIQLTH